MGFIGLKWDEMGGTVSKGHIFEKPVKYFCQKEKKIKPESSQAPMFNNQSTGNTGVRETC